MCEFHTGFVSLDNNVTKMLTTCLFFSPFSFNEKKKKFEFQIVFVILKLITINAFHWVQTSVVSVQRFLRWLQLGVQVVLIQQIVCLQILQFYTRSVSLDNNESKLSKRKYFQYTLSNRSLWSHAKVLDPPIEGFHNLFFINYFNLLLVTPSVL